MRLAVRPLYWRGLVPDRPHAHHFPTPIDHLATDRWQARTRKADLGVVLCTRPHRRRANPFRASAARRMEAGIELRDGTFSRGRRFAIARFDHRRRPRDPLAHARGQARAWGQDRGTDETEPACVPVRLVPHSGTRCATRASERDPDDRCAEQPDRRKKTRHVAWPRPDRRPVSALPVGRGSHPRTDRAGFCRIARDALDTEHFASNAPGFSRWLERGDRHGVCASRGNRPGLAGGAIESRRQGLVHTGQRFHGVRGAQRGVPCRSFRSGAGAWFPRGAWRGQVGGGSLCRNIRRRAGVGRASTHACQLGRGGTLRGTDHAAVVLMSKLTVVQVLPALESGGVERGTLEVAEHLVRKGHRSIVISAGGRMVKELEAGGSEHLSLAIGRKSLLTLRLIPRLRRFLVDNAVDILHVRSRMPAWVCYLAWKGMNSGNRPHLAATVHGMYSVNAYSAVMTRGETVIAVSETVRDYILRNYPAVAQERIVVIPRGIDPGQYPHGFQPPADWLAAWRAEHPQLAGKKVLTLPGRITRLKGHEDFIELIGRLRQVGEDVHGLIVGGAEAKKRPYLAELTTSVAQHGLADDVTFTGQRADLREIMAVSDIVLSLSKQPESFGRTVTEAISLGRPVIGYNHGGVGEQLQRMFPQGLVPIGDMDGLLELCRTLDVSAPVTPLTAPSSLQDMLDMTLDVYEAL